MIYLDANVLIAAAVNVQDEDRTARVCRLALQRPTMWVSPLAEYEAKKHLYQSGEQDWQEDMENFLQRRRLADEWSGPILKALRLAQDFKARLAVDSADTLHVAWALSIGARTFASFDRASGPRALALCCNLEIWPEPTQEDFVQMKRLKA